MHFNQRFKLLEKMRKCNHDILHIEIWHLCHGPRCFTDKILLYHEHHYQQSWILFELHCLRYFSYQNIFLLSFSLSRHSSINKLVCKYHTMLSLSALNCKMLNFLYNSIKYLKRLSLLTGVLVCKGQYNFCLNVLYLLFFVLLSNQNLWVTLHNSPICRCNWKTHLME